MTRFRYDVVIRKCGAQHRVPSVTVTERAPEPCTLEGLRSLVRSTPTGLRVTGIPNARVSAAAAALEALEHLAPADRLGELAGGAINHKFASVGIDPEDVRELDVPCDVVIEWSAAGRGYFDAVFRPRMALAATDLESGTAASGAGWGPADQRPTPQPPDWAAYANRPVLPEIGGTSLVPTLREHLRGTLPEYMLPSAYVLLDALPLTPNGKLDRQALPAPDRARQETATVFTPPATVLERNLVGIFQELLGLAEVGIDDNFFDLSANSLMMVRVVEKIRAELGLKVSLVRFFQFPTLRSLAAAISGSENEAVRGQGQPDQNRGQLRKDMMQRRREVRGGRSTAA